MGKINRVLFLGSKQIGLNSLSTIFNLDKSSLIGVITLDDRNDSRNVFEEIQQFCDDRNINIYVVKNKQESEELIIKLKPELCIVVGWYWYIPKKIIDTVPEGFLGIHGSLLPKYRGGSPLVWAIINGEKNAGVTLFSFSEGLDNGPIWDQRIVELQPDDYVYEILKKIEDAATDIFQKKYLLILNGLIKPEPQNDAEATYCAQRIPEDGMIDWKKPAKDIYNFIRAQSHPYPGSFTIFNGEPLRILQADFTDMSYFGTPGQVGKITNEGVYIICGDNKPIIVKDVQYRSTTTIPAKSIITSIKIRFENRI
jgi:methionyl-tRNA formyltransferase